MLLLVLLAPRAAAQGGGPGDELTVHLLTMGTGDMVWEKYGHNALWIHDPVAGTDWVFNYGVFDFDSPGSELVTSKVCGAPSVPENCSDVRSER